MQETTQLSRRNVIKAGLVGAAALGGAHAAAQSALPKWDREFDVIVVGSGLAGLCAAITAAELGRSTIVLEKMGVPGGSSVISGGTYAACNTPAQKAQGIQDSVELYMKDVLTGRTHLKGLDFP